MNPGIYPFPKPLREWIGRLFESCYPKLCVFRVDAGRVRGLSFGHLMRCLILSRVLKELFACETLFIMRDYPEGVDYALKSGEKVLLLKHETDSTERDLLQKIMSTRPDLLVLDLPYSDFNVSKISKIKKFGTKVLLINDDNFVSSDADILINSSILAPERYKHQENDGSIRLLGPEYFIFDDKQKLSHPVRTEGKINVLLTFGGSDPTDITVKVISTILDQYHDSRIIFRIILGPGYGNLSAARQLAENNDGFELVRSPQDIYPYYMGSELTVCAGGRSMYELLSMGRRFFPIATTKHEAEIVQAFMQRGLIEAGLSAWNPQCFIHILEKILSQEVARL